MNNRQTWFINRIKECLDELHKLHELNDWIEYKNQAHLVACELMYAITEWDKHYRDLEVHHLT